jgi:hypothetical protein
MSSAPITAVLKRKPARKLVRLYTEAQTFERLPLFHISDEDAESGDNDADAKFNKNMLRQHLNKQMTKCEAVLARAVVLCQHAHKVPVVAFNKKTPKRRPDDHWTCSHCPGEHFSDMASHLSDYHFIGVTSAEWEARRGEGVTDELTKSVIKTIAYAK